MQYRSGKELRELFLSFFEEKGCTRFKSFSLIPEDPTLLFTIAGMVPFKPYFLGIKTPEVTRATTSQKCIRTNDIENVGRTARHHTFFEMLGNFSFGDYFKKEIIPWSWEFLTERIGLDPDKLYVTIYLDDDEAYEIWSKDVGIANDRIVRLGDDDNFWAAGPTGPCGPCSEIMYDQGPEFSCGKPNCFVGCDCDRYLEVWNLVFMQYNRDENGKLSLLPKKNIDTGMGLERLAALMQGVNSIFDVDTMKAIRDHVCQLANVTYGKSEDHDISIRVITDHIRSVTFMAADGVLPSNEGCGYVMRRLLRRAVRHGKLLGINGLFLKEIVKTVVDNSKHEYTELEDKYEYIVKLLTVEEENFNQTIDKGLAILKGYIEDLEKANKTILDGVSCFTLYDTYGFPIDLTKEILSEKGFIVDEEGFKLEMEKQREKARSSRVATGYMGSDKTVFHKLDNSVKTNFVGYTTLETESSIDYITNDEDVVDTAIEGDTVYIITHTTPFYAESGGQAGDKGIVETATGKAEITNTTKVIGDKYAHTAKVVQGNISKGQNATFAVATDIRMNTARNHSATHLLQKALREIVGTHIEQAGSNVNEDRLRFDYTHFEPLSEMQIQQVEDLVNQKIFMALPIEIKETSIDEARKQGAMALFGEKYGSVVRMVRMGDFSVELCGGTHLKNTAEIGTFKIISETGVASGVRRIEAVTGRGALLYYQNLESSLNSIAQLVKAKKNEVVKKVDTLLQENKILQKENEKLKAQLSNTKVNDILGKAEKIDSFNVLIHEVENLDMNALRNMGDSLKEKLEKSVIVLASKCEGKVNLIAMASKEAVESGIHCGHIIAQSVKAVNGGGGGKPNMAQAGGKDPSKINEAFNIAKQVILSQITK